MSSNDTASPAPPNFENTECLTLAREYARLIGDVPSSFSSTIRLLNLDQQKSGSISVPSQFEVTRLLKGPSLRSSFLFATMTFRDEHCALAQDQKIADLIKIYTPVELAALVGCIYLYRAVRKRVPEDEWTLLTKGMNERTDVGGYLGLSISAVGLPIGLYSSLLAKLACGPLIIHDLKGFKEYRRYLKINNLSHDFNYELQRWQCTQVHLAAALLQNLGLGLTSAEALVSGFGPGASFESKLSDPAYAFFISRFWTDELLKSGEVPDITHKGKFFPSKERLAWLKEKVADLRANGSKFAWLDKSKEDLNNLKPPPDDALPEGGEDIAAEIEESIS